MSNFYPYLISSLPMLYFLAKAPFSFDKFLKSCQDFIPHGDFAIISKFSGPNTDSGKIIQPTVKRWVEFDAQLRNELVKVRAVRRHVDPAKYLKPDICSTLSIAHIALAAQRSVSIIEGEKLLDYERWKFLDELAVGHYFDVDALVVYAYKLLILIRWENINLADKEALLKEAVSI